jgi:hypothetical protein
MAQGQPRKMSKDRQEKAQGQAKKGTRTAKKRHKGSQENGKCQATKGTREGKEKAQGKAR